MPGKHSTVLGIIIAFVVISTGIDKLFSMTILGSIHISIQIVSLVVAVAYSAFYLITTKKIIYINVIVLYIIVTILLFFIIEGLRSDQLVRSLKRPPVTGTINSSK